MLQSFTAELARALRTIKKRDFDAAVKLVLHIRQRSGVVYFIGNGGSAAIASHMAIDWMNKGGCSTRDLNNPAALTCLANDYGYEQVFTRQLNDFVSEDLLVAISSSGKSPNILKAVDLALYHGAYVIGLSGFDKSNPLQTHKAKCDAGFFHIPSDNYAIVENAHMAILHAMLESLKGR